MAKIYLSPAAHEHDRSCVYRASCSENTHANLFLDELVVYLDACGIAYKRHAASDVGEEGMKRAVAESNAWKPDLHYVVHTNAFDGTVKGSRPQVYTGSVKGNQYAQTILQYRKEIYPYPCQIFERTDLYELRATVAPCVYEELVFHDNPDDCAFLHEHMRDLAAAVCKAFCAILGLSFRDPYNREAGDINGDGRVDPTDAQLALQQSVNLVQLSDEEKKRADLDQNGTVDPVDGMLILQQYVGQEPGGEG